MKFLLAALAAVCSASVANLHTFEEFTKAFDKKYDNEEEKLYRRKVYEASLAQVLAHNVDTTQTWTKAINQFSDRTPEEFRNSHGWKPYWALKGERTFKAAPPLPVGFKLSDLPDSIDWREKGVITNIKNQGMCGSCWAFASTEVIESHVALNTSTLVELSPQNLVSCDSNPDHCGGKGGCLGSIPELAFKFVMDHGLASEADWPYRSGGTSQDGDCNATIKATASIDGWVKLEENNYTQVMYTLANVGPVAINVDAIPMQSYGGGLFKGCSLDKMHIDHVVQLVGYGVDAEANKYWIIRNSWGDTWGDAGYMHLLRHDPAEDWCSYDIYPADGTGCDNGPGTVTACGSCGVVYDVSYPTGATLL